MSYLTVKYKKLQWKTSMEQINHVINVSCCSHEFSAREIDVWMQEATRLNYPILNHLCLKTIFMN